jgi:hypothetical protein
MQVNTPSTLGAKIVAPGSGRTITAATTTIQNVNLDVKISIDNLEGNEEDIEDWYDNSERVSAAYGRTNEV